jgi:multidrug efflux pump subunit AcrA (membrane-fusion protein)
MNTTIARAFLCATIVSTHAGFVWAHGDEDHSQDKKQPGKAVQEGTLPSPSGAPSERASRLADGSVYFPKAAQRQAGLLTQPAERGRYPKTVELAGKVIGDPAVSGRVQATQSGRIEPGKAGLATVGRKVAAGEVLGYLRPVSSSLERGAQQAQVAELKAQLAVAERKFDRARQLEGLTPQKEIEAARIEVEGVRARLAALQGGLDGIEALTSPVPGVVAAVNIVAGQVVEARELLFEIVNPQRLAIEALAYDAALVDGTVGGSFLIGDGAGTEKRRGARLRYVGGAPQLREGALPLLFRVEQSGRGSPLPLAVGQSVSVLVETRERLEGVAVPTSAIVRDNQGETQVWVKTAPERFQPRRVRAVPVDSRRVVVTEGVEGGDRVVSEGATSLTLVR